MPNTDPAAATGLPEDELSGPSLPSWLANVEDALDEAERAIICVTMAAGQLGDTEGLALTTVLRLAIRKIIEAQDIIRDRPREEEDEQ